MNALPESRRAIYGRTFSQRWDAAAMDPIEHWPRTGSRAATYLGAALAIVLGIAGGVLLANWWSA